LLLFGDVSDIGIILANYVSPVFSTNTDLIAVYKSINAVQFWVLLNN